VVWRRPAGRDTRAVTGAAATAAELAFAAEPLASQTAQLFLLLRNGTATQLTHGAASMTVESWSPDGRSLLALASGPAGQELVSVSIPDGRLTPLWRGGAIGPALWSPDGRSIAVEWDGRLSILDAHGTIVRTPDEAMVRQPAAAAPPFAWSPDSRRLAVSYLIPTGTSLAIEQAGERLPPQILSPCGRSLPCQDVEEPSWAPGSDAVAFVRRHHHRSSLWWWTGRAPAPFPTDGLPGDVHDPAWAPDGRRLALDTPRGIFLIDAPSAPARRLTAVVASGPPAWSDDGSRLAFVTSARTGPQHVLWVMDVASGDSRAYRGGSATYQDVVGRVAWRPGAS
jgi:Tol biopolymer transport system component